MSGAGPGYGMHARGRGRDTRGHQHGSSKGGSLNGRKAELTSAYSSLAFELTRKEINAVGGYALGRTIGEGSFGKVRLGVHRLTNTRVAIKQVPKSLPFSSDPSSPLSLLTREIHHHRRLRHPHILPLYEIIATESSIYLVTELCAGGTLFDYLVECTLLPLPSARRIFGQLVLGVGYMHGEGVVHRDLKLENVLLDEKLDVRIADLGFGREWEKGRWMETWVGTLGYCAPEIIAAKRYLGEEVDIWSLGIILYTLLMGSLPFDDDDEGLMKEKILKGEYGIPDWLDHDAADLISLILVIDPLRRLSLKGILSHPFFTHPPATVPHRYSQSYSHPPSIAEEPHDLPSTTDDNSLSSDPSEPSHSSSSLDLNQSREGTPITSEDGSEISSLSVVQAGKERAIDQSAKGEDRLGLLQRNESQSTIKRRSPSLTDVSLTPRSTTIEEEPSFHVGPVPHSRTPLRTKRRSLSAPLLTHLSSPPAPSIDYLELLSMPHAPPLSTRIEMDLLGRLRDLGFDEGQVEHSIRTDACDSCGAVWWMLLRKLEEKEREAAYRAAMDVVEEAPLFETSHHAFSTTSFDVPHSNRPLTPSTPPVLSTAEAEERLGYFLNGAASVSAPLLSYFPAVEPSSPRKSMARSKSKDYLANSTTPSPTPSTKSPYTNEDEGGVVKRSRSGSVGMLARATSVIGSLSLLTRMEDASSSPTVSPSTSTLPLSNLFGRRPSASGQGTDESKVTTPTVQLSPSKGQPVVLLSTASSTPTKGSVSTSVSQGTFSTITPPATSKQLPTTLAPVGTKPKAVKPSKASLFSNFKMWFGDDKKKRKRNPAASTSHTRVTSPSRGSGTVTRRSMRLDGTYVPSPLKRPPIGSRASSNGSIAAQSRRSSFNSVRHQHADHLPPFFSPGYAHHRRRSDGSRASSDRGERSRPPSLRSASGASNSGGRRPPHSKAGSFASLSSPTPKELYRRPPTSTIVRRLGGSSRHSRQRSTGSSIATRRSSTSSIEGDLTDEPHPAEPILEEDEENEDRAASERHRAFRKLSGDLRPSFSSRPSFDSHHSHSSDHRPAVFVAHKSRHVFGAPSQPSASSSLSRKHSHTNLRPALRDVFAGKDVDGEWIDEADELGGYGGGLGQAPTRSEIRRESFESVGAGVGGYVDSPTSEKFTGGIGMFEGRYAGVQAQGETGSSTSGPGSWRAGGGGTSRAPVFRAAVVIEEEEEEEE